MAITNIIKSITLDVYDHDKTPKSIKSIAADNDTRYIAAEIQCEGERYDIGESAAVELIILRPDKVGVEIAGSPYAFSYETPGSYNPETGEETPGETITYYGVYAELDQAALVKSGTLLGQFKIASGEQVLRTELFKVNNGRALDAETSEWAGEYQGYNLDELVQSVNETVAKVDTMEDDVSDLKSGFNDLYNTAYVTDSASGSVAHFVDGANGVPLKSLKVNIEPVQSGSGDPSPENIRPISGFNSVKVTRAGKNLLDTSNMSTASMSGVTYSRSDDGVITVGGKATAVAYKQIAQLKTINGVQYTITGSPNGAANGKYRMTVVGYGYEYGSGYTFTGDGNTHDITLDVYAGYPDSGTLTFKPMIRAASIADDTYEPYNGNTNTISLSSAGTVYGGTLDVVSGVLTVYPYYASYNGETLTGEWISDRDVYAEGTTPTIGAQVVNIGAVGTEYQITPTEIKTLLGINNIWSDAGDVDVEYRADTKLYIKRLTGSDTDMISDANIVSGQYFMVGNDLYKATVNIASGAQIVVGTNATKVSLSEALNQIKEA